MLIFPKEVRPAARYILLMYLEHGKNKKAAAHFSGISVRRAQEVTKKYSYWLEGYKKAREPSL